MCAAPRACSLPRPPILPSAAPATPSPVCPAPPHRGSATQTTQGHSGLQRCRGRLSTLVLHAAGKAGAVPCLFKGVTGENTVTHGGGFAQGHLGEAVRDRLAHVVEVRGTAT